MAPYLLADDLQWREAHSGSCLALPDVLAAEVVAVAVVLAHTAAAEHTRPAVAVLVDAHGSAAVHSERLHSCRPAFAFH